MTIKNLNINKDDVFGRLTVIKEQEERGKKGSRIYLCTCECGNEVNLKGYTLKNGHTKSCGCLVRELSATKGKNRVKHGKCRTPEYYVWNGIKQRCLNPNDTGYRNYGARGITIHQDWVDSFSNFLESVGIRPEKGYHLDRIDNNRGYEPGNCRWVSPTVNQNNKRNVPWLEIDGENKPLHEWLSIHKTGHVSYHRRILNGLSPKEALQPRIGGEGTKKRIAPKIQKLVNKTRFNLPSGVLSVQEVISHLEKFGREEPATKVICSSRKGVVNMLINFND